MFRGQPPDGDLEVATQTKDVVTPEARTDVPMTLTAGLLDACERAPVILTEGAAPNVNVVASPGHFNG